MNKGAEAISKILMTINKAQKGIALKDRNTEILIRLFVVAYDKEDYEVCQVLKEILDEKEPCI